MPDAVERVAGAAAEVMEKRLDLLQHDLRSAARKMIAGAVGGVAAGFFGIICWLALSAALRAALLEDFLVTPPIAWLGVAALNVTAGAVMWMLARRERGGRG